MRDCFGRPRGWFTARCFWFQRLDPFLQASGRLRSNSRDGSIPSGAAGILDAPTRRRYWPGLPAAVPGLRVTGTRSTSLEFPMASPAPHDVILPDQRSATRVERMHITSCHVGSRVVAGRFPSPADAVPDIWAVAYGPGAWVDRDCFVPRVPNWFQRNPRPGARVLPATPSQWAGGSALTAPRQELPGSSFWPCRAPRLGMTSLPAPTGPAPSGPFAPAPDDASGLAATCQLAFQTREPPVHADDAAARPWFARRHQALEGPAASHR